MFIIEVGLITAGLLAAALVSVVLKTPCPKSAKRWFLVGPKKFSVAKASRMNMVGLYLYNVWYNATHWVHLLLNLVIVVGLYYFMGISLSAHVAVISFELLWFFVIGPAFALIVDSLPERQYVRRRDVRRFSCVAS